MTRVELLGELERLVHEADQAALPHLVGALEAARAAAWVRMIQPVPAATTATTPDKNISVEEAACSLGMSPSWLYKNRDELSFVGRIGRRVVCSAAGVERYRRRRLNGSP